MTTTTAPARPARPARTEFEVRCDRITARADALHAHADGIVPGGTNPITKESTVSREARDVAEGVDTVEGFAALAHVARLRRQIAGITARCPQGSESRILTDDEVRGLALRAVAALGRTADVKRHAGTYRPAYLRDRLVAATPGGPRDYHPVGPYVTDAVRWVLDDERGTIARSGADHDLVQAYAALHNVVARAL